MIGQGAGIIFKGSGFYQTDYRKASAGGGETSAGSSTSGSDSASGKASGTSSENKKVAGTGATKD